MILRRFYSLPLRKPIQGVQNIVMVASGKGGVGKSTVSVNLAAALQSQGFRAGILDADLYGPSIPRLLGLQHVGKEHIQTIQGDSPSAHLLEPVVSSDGLKSMSMGFLVGHDAPIVWRGLMVMKGLEQLIRQVNWSPLDYLIVDMPPGTGDAHLTLTQNVLIDAALLVTTPQEVALSDARRCLQMLQRFNVPVLGYVKNMSGFVCPHCKTCSPIFPNSTEHPLQLECLVEIPLDPQIAVLSDSGRLVAPGPENAYHRLALRVVEGLKSVKSN